MRWLEPYDYEVIRQLTPRMDDPLPEPPDEEETRRVAIRETGGPLRELPADIDRFHAYAQLDSDKMPKQMLARQEVIDRIRQAERLLPDPFSLTVLDTWRSKEAQRELGRIYGLDPKYVADPDDEELVAPHTMGAAVDLTLSVAGKPLPLGSDFDQFDETSAAMHLERKPNLSKREKLDRDLRRLLGKVMLEAGFAPLSSEWWHWSYGDQRWAAFTGRGETLFAQIG